MRAVTPKYSGRIWPSGRFGVSRVREAPFPSSGQSHPETDESQWDSAAVAVHGAEAVLKFKGKWEKVAHPDLSNVSKSPIAAKRGQKGITRHGRNLIESAAVLVERRYERRLLSFGTVTLPNAPVEQLRSVASHWSAVVKQFVKNLTRGLEAQNLPSFVFGVTEIQEKRFEKTGVPALHLHFVFVGRNSIQSAWQVSRKNIRKWWQKALSAYISADVDFSATENVQQIKKSAAAYLGKYLSKGSAVISKVIEQSDKDWIPSAWYTISHSLRRKVLAQVISGEQCGEMLNWLCHNVMQGWLAWLQPIKIKSKDGFEFEVGFGGRFTRQGMSAVAQIFPRPTF